MNYCLLVLTSMHDKGNKVSLKARGRVINRTVDLEEVTRKRFMKDSPGRMRARERSHL